MASPANPGPGKVDFGKALGFVFEDPDWLKKMLLGGLCALLSVMFIGTFLIGGYFLRLVRRAARGEARPLPEWEDWGGLLVEGLLAFGVYLAHMLAVMLPLFVAGGCLLGLAAAGAGGGEDRHGAEVFGAMAGLGIVALYGVLIVLSMALGLYMPAVLARLAILRRFGVVMEVRENFGFIKRNLGEYLLSLAVFLVASIISQFGVILLCIGIFPLSFWAYCVLAYPLGQIAGRDPVLGPAARTAG